MLETCILGKPLMPVLLSIDPSPFSVTQSFLIYFGWVNDIALVNIDTGLIMCSSDLSVQFTNLKTGVHHPFTHIHSDYVQRAEARHKEQEIVIAALGEKILVWDLQRLELS